MKVMAIAGTTLRRTFRRRSNLFFLVVFPLLMVLALGLTFGGSGTPRVGVVSGGSGKLGQDLVTRLEQLRSIQVVRVSDRSSLQTEVARGELSAGVVVPSGFDATLRAGGRSVVTYLARPSTSNAQLGETIRQAVAQQSEVVGAARFSVAQGVVPNLDAGLDLAARVKGQAPVVSVAESTAGHTSPFASVTAYDLGAWTELLLFVFLMALIWGAVGLIEIHRLRIGQRMLATPTPPLTVIAGLVVGRTAVALVQAALIILGTAVFFRVHWGDPLGVAALVITFALVAAGAGLLLGTILRNEQQASGFTVLIGLGLAAIGGCMVPLEVFSPTMQTVAHITPHAWANDAFAKLVGQDASVVQILPQLGVIAAYAAVVLTAATLRLRRILAN